MSGPRLVPWALAVLVTATGCTAAGMAAGPVLTAISIVSDRSVERTVAADLTTAWAATVDALSRMAVRIDESDRKDEAWTLRGTGETVTVHATLSRVTPVMTRVSLRVEAGGITADKKTGEEILNQVAGTLTAAASAWAASAERSAASERFDALHREIQRLRSSLDDRREATRPPAPALPTEPAAPAIAPGRIIVIPTSAGLPSAATDARATVTEAPATVPQRPESAPPAAESRPAVEARPPSQDTTLAAPLTPAAVLTPVESLGTRRSGQ